jgi:type IV pilus assembly protein PilQ
MVRWHDAIAVTLGLVVPGVFTGGSVVFAALQPAQTMTTQITAVNVNSTAEGLELVLNMTTEGSTSDTATPNHPQIFMIHQGDRWIANLLDSHLNLSGGDSFTQDHPITGIRSLTVHQLDANTVQITATGVTSAPTGEVLRQTGRELAFAIHTASESRSHEQQPEAQQSNNRQPNLQQVERQAELPLPTLPFSSRSLSQAPSSPSERTATPEVLVPNPTITIEGSPAPASASGQPPLLPRAIAPPLGDIAVSNIDASSTTIDLGTSERVPRLVVREAPVREVLALLARAAGLNLAYDEVATNTETATANRTSQPTISLDVENEPIQDLFNYVLQLSGLEGTRRGRTIFVGTRLPNAARNLIVRSLRLNQVQVGVALNFLVGMGAESAISRERLVTSVNAVPVQLPSGTTTATSSAITQTQTTTEQRLETQRVNYEDSMPPLRGLLVLGDERTNTLTMVGTVRQVELATAGTIQLDLRRRQVAVNVRVVDLNLSQTERAGGSFSFGIGDFFFRGLTNLNISGLSSLNYNNYSDNRTGNAFSALLQTEISNGNGKILTDPTLIVQEGQKATVALTNEVQTTTGKTTFNERGDVTSFQQDPPRAAGLTLVIEINRIDDNGFVSLSVAPTITAPVGQQTNPDRSVTTLLSSRSLETGLVRLRDGQTLILSGIIQDSDRTTVSKVPILGDIPLLGLLFRSTERQNERREVVVLLTPQIINDSDQSSFGYSYTPSRDAQQLLEQHHHE